MNDKPVTVKVWEETRTMIKVIAAEKHMTMVGVIHNLVKDEYRRRSIEKSKINS